MRIDKLLSSLKYGTRSEIKKYISKKYVTVNGEVIRAADYNVNPECDVIVFAGEQIFYKENITIMLNKPQGYLCSNIDEEYPSVLNLLDEKMLRFDWKFCGRLDVDTEGLVILTTDGNLVHRIISPNHDIMKTYYVKTRLSITNVEVLEQGMDLLDGQNRTYRSKSAKVTMLSNCECMLSISEGKFHQVKRMFEAIGNEVIHLKRVKIGNLVLPAELKVGHYREISENIIFS